MRALRTVLVDDEPLALDFLALLLQAHEDVEVVARCENGREAIHYLSSNNVDLLLLDIQMPTTDGFDVVAAMGEAHLPPVIFITAFHEHAIRAFDVEALDYLTKPLDAARLGKAIERVRNRISANEAVNSKQQLSAVIAHLSELTGGTKTSAPRFLVKDGECEVLVPADRIDWIEAAQYYSCLHTSGRRYMLREPISELERRLDPRQFVRIHRSVIVNLDRVQEIYKDGRTESIAVLSGGQKVKVSKRGRDKLVELGRG